MTRRGSRIPSSQGITQSGVIVADADKAKHLHGTHADHRDRQGRASTGRRNDQRLGGYRGRTLHRAPGCVWCIEEPGRKATKSHVWPSERGDPPVEEFRR